MPRKARDRKHIKRVVFELDTTDPAEAALYAQIIEWTRNGKAKATLCRILMDELGIPAKKAQEAPVLPPPATPTPRPYIPSNLAPAGGQKLPTVDRVRQAPVIGSAPAVAGVEDDPYWNTVPGFIRHGKK